MNKWPKLGRGKYFANDRIWVELARNGLYMAYFCTAYKRK
jgi:hypothetical protein